MHKHVKNYSEALIEQQASVQRLKDIKKEDSNFLDLVRELWDGFIDWIMNHMLLSAVILGAVLLLIAFAIRKGGTSKSSSKNESKQNQTVNINFNDLAKVFRRNKRNDESDDESCGNGRKSYNKEYNARANNLKSYY